MTKITKHVEATGYCSIVTYNFGDRFVLNVVKRLDDPNRCTIELIDETSESMGDSYICLEDIPLHQAESLARRILDELGVK